MIKIMGREEVLEIVRVAREKRERPDLREANLSGVDLSEVDLSWANLNRAILIKTVLIKTVLIRASLSVAYLRLANLSRAFLYGANLSGANLMEANLSGAYLREANLREANLSGANLSGANLSRARTYFTVFGNTDLTDVKGLETVEHQGPSSIGMDMLFKSKSQIPEVFLRGIGVPEVLITYLPSMLGQTIQYYSCFISYSAKDTPLATRLHADLQQAGVRCWFAPEDMKIGDKIRPRIDESIRVHEKLLLILSEHSLASDWVEHEVEAALEQERQRKETVLFPIRVDEAVMRSEVGWAAHIKRTRNIGDFQEWEGHESYQKAFQRLLKDLKV